MVGNRTNVVYLVDLLLRLNEVRCKYADHTVFGT